MPLENKVKEVLENFDSTPSNKIIDILNNIQNHFQSQITKDYLKKKLTAIENSPEEEKKKLCKNLKPYFDWYLQKI